jgi:hypothetical protein
MTTALLLAFLGACGGTVTAPYGSIVDPGLAAIDFSFGEAFEAEDGKGYLLRQRAYVYLGNAETGFEPVNGVAMTVQAEYPGVYVLPDEALSDVTADYGSSCGAGTANDMEGCAKLLTVSGEGYQEVSATYDYVDDFRPNTMTASTDAHGALGYNLFFDAMPSEGTFAIRFDITVDEALIAVTVASD